MNMPATLLEDMRIAELICGKPAPVLTKLQQQYLKRTISYSPTWVENIIRAAVNDGLHDTNYEKQVDNTRLKDALEYLRAYIDPYALSLQNETLATMLKLVNGSHLSTPAEIADRYLAEKMIPEADHRFNSYLVMIELQKKVSEIAAVALGDCKTLLVQRAFKPQLNEWTRTMHMMFRRKESHEFSDYREALEEIYQLTKQLDTGTGDKLFHETLEKTIYRFHTDLNARLRDQECDSMDARKIILFGYLPIYAQDAHIAWALNMQICDLQDNPLRTYNGRQLVYDRGYRTMADLLKRPLSDIHDEKLENRILEFLRLTGLV